MYLDVVEIVEQDGHFKVGGARGSGEPAVWMRRLPEDGMLPELLERDAVDSRLARRIGRTIAEFHADAQTGRGIDQYGSPSSIEGNWQENFQQMAPFVGRTVEHDINAHIRSYVDQFLATNRRLFERRVADGRVRDGHGDLHAASICIDRGRIRLFDSLQFAPRFRSSDVAAEVAFLAMDFEHHGRTDLAWAFVDAYVGASGDSEVQQLFDFYACYRAYVRGKVRSLRLAQLADARADETRDHRRIARLLRPGLGARRRMREPPLLICMGLPGERQDDARARTSPAVWAWCTCHPIGSEKPWPVCSQRNAARDSFRQGMYDPSMTERTYAALRRNAARWLRRGTRCGARRDVRRPGRASAQSSSWPNASE